MQHRPWSRLLVLTLSGVALLEMCLRYILRGNPIAIVLPPPSEVCRAILDAVSQPQFVSAILFTCGSTTLGFALGVVLGVFLGAVCGSFKWAEAYALPLLNTLRSLPAVLYVPLAVVLLGVDVRTPVALAAGVTALYAAVPITYAVRDYDDEKLLFLSLRGYGWLRRLIGFVLPEVISSLHSSLSIAATLSLAVTVVAEMILPGFGGVGTRLIRAKEVSDYAGLWAYTVILGCLGLVFHQLVMLLLHYSAPWVRRGRET